MDPSRRDRDRSRARRVSLLAAVVSFVARRTRVADDRRRDRRHGHRHARRRRRMELGRAADHLFRVVDAAVARRARAQGGAHGVDRRKGRRARRGSGARQWRDVRRRGARDARSTRTSAGSRLAPGRSPRRPPTRGRPRSARSTAASRARFSTWRRVPAGTSGGVSPIGTLAMVAGALFIGASDRDVSAGRSTVAAPRRDRRSRRRAARLGARRHGAGATLVRHLRHVRRNALTHDCGTDNPAAARARRGSTMISSIFSATPRADFWPHCSRDRVLE